MLTWGYDGVAHGDLRWWDGDATLNQLRWCARNGFRVTGIRNAELADPARRGVLESTVRELGLKTHVHFGADWWALTAAECHRQAEAFLRDLDTWSGFDIPFVGTGSGNTHRYLQDRPLERQLEHLSACLGPLARRLADRGTPLALHNGFDYTGEDLAALCRRTPGLGLLYDTGNVMVVGADPLTSARAAAPHVVATHLKDHVVYPWNDPRGKARGIKIQAFVIEGAALGEGHGRVAEVMRAIHAGHRDPARIIWGWEVEPAEGTNGQEAVDRSWTVCRAFEKEVA